MYIPLVAFTLASLLARCGCSVSYLQKRSHKITSGIAAFATECARRYTVKKGDICDSISASEKVSTCVSYAGDISCPRTNDRYQLSAINPQINERCTNLVPGETLCLGYPKEDCSIVHVVQMGDTCDTIEEAAGIDEMTFYANNPQLDDSCSNLYIGEVSPSPNLFLLERADEMERRLCAHRRKFKFPR
jgi:hypothetical protein